VGKEELQKFFAFCILQTKPNKCKM